LEGSGRGLLLKVVYRLSPGGAEDNLSGWRVGRPRFEPGISRIRSGSDPVDHEVREPYVQLYTAVSC
jgi:hypothetical protein